MNNEKLPSALIVEGEDKNLIESKVNKIVLSSFCLKDGLNPCGQCEGCRKVKEKIHPDLIYVYPEKKAYSVEQVRDVKKQAYLPPNEAKRKIFIFTDGEALSDYSQNALLKILEEPPSYAVFIIQIDNRKRLLSTVLSRCTVIRAGSSEIFYDDEVIKTGDKLLEVCLKSDEYEIMKTVSKCAADSSNFDLSLSYIEQKAAKEIMENDDERIQNKLINIVQIFREYKKRDKKNANKRLNLTMLICELGNLNLEEIK